MQTCYIKYLHFVFLLKNLYFIIDFFKYIEKLLDYKSCIIYFCNRYFFAILNLQLVVFLFYLLSFIQSRHNFVLNYLHLINPNFSSRYTQIQHNKSRSFVLLISGLLARLRLDLIDLASLARIQKSKNLISRDVEIAS